ncbi:Cyclohexadienyl dehydratase [Candidatus Entotheonellaceae bacterium PAL068K]
MRNHFWKPGVIMLIGVVVVFLTSGAGWAQEKKSHLFRILERGVLRVGTSGDYKPFSFVVPKTEAEKGRLARAEVGARLAKKTEEEVLIGYDIDAAKKLAEDLGVKLEFVSFEWRNLIAGLVADKYDIAMSGITIRLERAKAVAFSEPYILIGSSPLVRQEHARKFRSWHDVDRPGVRLVVVLGTSNDQIVTKRFKRATIKRITAPASVVAELLANRADATITDNIAAVMQQQDHPEALYAVNPRHPFEKDFFGYPVRQGDQTWLNFVNTWVKLNAQDGFFEQLEQKWIAWE